MSEPVVAHASLGDINGDGTSDLLLTNAAVAEVRVVFGGDAGTGIPPTVLATAGEPVMATAAALGGDDALDVGVVNPAEGVDVFLGLGGGQFHAGENTAVPSGGRRMYTGGVWTDLDSDGLHDVVTESANLSTVDVYLGAQAGTMRHVEGWSIGHEALAVGDLDGDGHAELVAATSSGLSIFPGSAGTVFDTSGPEVYDLGACIDVEMGLFDGDASLDIALLTRSDGLLVLRNLGNGVLDDPVMYAAPDLTMMAVHDLNGDARDDFVLGTPGGMELSLYLSGAE